MPFARSTMGTEVEYSEKYVDDEFEYRCGACPSWPPPALWRASEDELHANNSHYLSARSHVILPKHISKNAPKGRLLTETEWRGVGVQQSRGWVHYAIHR